METKDWIIMLIPILVNAILVFPLHKYIDWKVEEKLEKKERQRKIENNLLDIVFRLFMKCSHIKRVIADEPQIVSSKEFNDEMRKLFRYFEINHNKLREYEGEIKSIYDNYFEILKLASNSSNDNNEEISRLDALQILIKKIMEKLQILYYKLTD